MFFFFKEMDEFIEKDKEESKAEAINRKCTGATTKRNEREPSERVVQQREQACQQATRPPRTSVTERGPALVTEPERRRKRGNEGLGAPSASVECRLSSVASMASLPDKGARGLETSVEDDSVARL